MTKQEVLDGLDGLKDLLNDGGKAQVEGLKAGVRGLVIVEFADPVVETARTGSPYLKAAENYEVEAEEKKKPLIPTRSYKRRK